jgi:hypothetical protein
MPAALPGVDHDEQHQHRPEEGGQDAPGQPVQVDARRGANSSAGTKM